MRVAFIGPMFSGKTTAAQHLVEEYGFIRMSFAGPVKVLVAEMLGLAETFLRPYGDPGIKWNVEAIEERKSHPGIRKLLQVIGTDIGREMYGQDVWVKKLEEMLPITLDVNVVVDDARFPNEIEMLERNGFTIVKLSRADEQNRLNLVRSKYPDSWRDVIAHTSETSLAGYKADVNIVASSHDDLLGLVDRLVQNLQSRIPA